MDILTTQEEALERVRKLSGLSEPRGHNTFIKVDHDYVCGCGKTHNTKSSQLTYLAVALPARHLFECPDGYITCIKQGMFSCKAEFSYSKELA